MNSTRRIDVGTVITQRRRKWKVFFSSPRKKISSLSHFPPLSAKSSVYREFGGTPHLLWCCSLLQDVQSTGCIAFRNTHAEGSVVRLLVLDAINNLTRAINCHKLWTVLAIMTSKCRFTPIGWHHSVLLFFSIRKLIMSTRRGCAVWMLLSIRLFLTAFECRTVGKNRKKRNAVRSTRSADDECLSLSSTT